MQTKGDTNSKIPQSSKNEIGYSFPIINGREFKTSPYFSSCELVDKVDEEKETIKYIIKNYNGLIRYTHRQLGVTKLYDCTEIISDLYLEMLKKDDYVPYCDEDGNIISLANFIKCTLKNCKKRYFSAVSKKTNNEKSNIQVSSTNKNEELDIFELLADEKQRDITDSIVENLDACLESCKCYRYILHMDLFEFIYISVCLLGDANTIEEETKSRKKYRKIMSTLGISEEISGIFKEKSERVDNIKVLLYSVANYICNGETDYVKSLVVKYLYGRKCIDNMITKL